MATTYNVVISRKGLMQKFNTEQELVKELRKHLSPSEIKSGALMRLTTFEMKTVSDGEYSYRFGISTHEGIVVCRYEFAD